MNESGSGGAKVEFADAVRAAQERPERQDRREKIAEEVVREVADASIIMARVQNKLHAHAVKAGVTEMAGFDAALKRDIEQQLKLLGTRPGGPARGETKLFDGVNREMDFVVERYFQAETRAKLVGSYFYDEAEDKGIDSNNPLAMGKFIFEHFTKNATPHGPISFVAQGFVYYLTFSDKRDFSRFYYGYNHATATKQALTKAEAYAGFKASRSADIAPDQAPYGQREVIFIAINEKQFQSAEAKSRTIDHELRHAINSALLAATGSTVPLSAISDRRFRPDIKGDFTPHTIATTAERTQDEELDVVIKNVQDEALCRVSKEGTTPEDTADFLQFHEPSSSTVILDDAYYYQYLRKQFSPEQLATIIGHLEKIKAVLPQVYKIFITRDERAILANMLSRFPLVRWDFWIPHIARVFDNQLTRARQYAKDFVTYSAPLRVYAAVYQPSSNHKELSEWEALFDQARSKILGTETSNEHPGKWGEQAAKVIKEIRERTNTLVLESPDSASPPPENVSESLDTILQRGEAIYRLVSQLREWQGNKVPDETAKITAIATLVDIKDNELKTALTEGIERWYQASQVTDKTSRRVADNPQRLGEWAVSAGKTVPVPINPFFITAHRDGPIVVAQCSKDDYAFLKSAHITGLSDEGWELSDTVSAQDLGGTLMNNFSPEHPVILVAGQQHLSNHVTARLKQEAENQLLFNSFRGIEYGDEKSDKFPLISGTLEGGDYTPVVRRLLRQIKSRLLAFLSTGQEQIDFDQLYGSISFPDVLKAGEQKNLAHLVRAITEAYHRARALLSPAEQDCLVATLATVPLTRIPEVIAPLSHRLYLDHHQARVRLEDNSLYKKALIDRLPVSLIPPQSASIVAFGGVRFKQAAATEARRILTEAQADSEQTVQNFNQLNKRLEEWATHKNQKATILSGWRVQKLQEHDDAAARVAALEQLNAKMKQAAQNIEKSYLQCFPFGARGLWPAYASQVLDDQQLDNARVVEVMHFREQLVRKINPFFRRYNRESYRRLFPPQVSESASGEADVLSSTEGRFIGEVQKEVDVIARKIFGDSEMSAQAILRPSIIAGIIVGNPPVHFPARRTIAINLRRSSPPAILLADFSIQFFERLPEFSSS